MEAHVRLAMGLLDRLSSSTHQQITDYKLAPLRGRLEGANVSYNLVPPG